MDKIIDFNKKVTKEEIKNLEEVLGEMLQDESQGGMLKALTSLNQE